MKSLKSESEEYQIMISLFRYIVNFQCNNSMKAQGVQVLKLQRTC